MKNSWIQCGVAAALAVAASAALGNAFSGAASQPGSLTFGGSSTGSYATISISTNSGGSYHNVLSGQFQGFFDPASEADAPGHEADDFFRFFCIDLTEFADTGPNTYTRNLGVPNATDSAELTRLFDQFYPNGATGTYYSGGQTNFGNFPDTNTAAAFQLAIWEIWFDTDNNLDLSTGAFRANSPSGVTSLAQSYLNAIGNGSTPAAGWTLYEFNNDGKQDYLSVENSGPLKTVPEPGTLILLGVGALAAWGTSKRHRKTA
jgi:PEP-CTERM motif/Thioester domain